VYVLGADAGSCLSASTKKQTTAETLDLSIKVKALFFEKEKKKSESTKSESAEATFTFSGYNSLFNSFQSRSFHTPNAKGVLVPYLTRLDAEAEESLREAAATSMQEVRLLERDAWDRVHKLGLKDGQNILLEKTGGICREGLVVQLMLAPYARLDEYVLWSNPLASRPA
jgi:hypothetical protein